MQNEFDLDVNSIPIHVYISCRAKGRVLEIVYQKREFTQEDDKKLNNGIKSIADCHNVWT